MATAGAAFIPWCFVCVCEKCKQARYFYAQLKKNHDTFFYSRAMNHRNSFECKERKNTLCTIVGFFPPIYAFHETQTRDFIRGQKRAKLDAQKGILARLSCVGQPVENK